MYFGHSISLLLIKKCTFARYKWVFIYNGIKGSKIAKQTNNGEIHSILPVFAYIADFTA